MEFIEIRNLTSLLTSEPSFLDINLTDELCIEHNRLEDSHSNAVRSELMPSSRSIVGLAKDTDVQVHATESHKFSSSSIQPKFGCFSFSTVCKVICRQWVLQLPYESTKKQTNKLQTNVVQLSRPYQGNVSQIQIRLVNTPHLSAQT
jgi:hypothetical protein